MKNKQTIVAFLAAIGGAVAFAQSATALPILSGSSVGGGTWEASDSEGRQASALFSATGTSGFTIVLSNDALIATAQPNELLAGLIIDFGFDAQINSVSVEATGGIGDRGPGYSLMDVYGVDYGLNLNGEWGYLDGADTGGYGDFAVGGTAYDPLGINPVIDPSYSYIAPPGTAGPDFLIAGQDTTGIVGNAVNFWATEFVTITFQTGLDFSGFDWADLDQVNFLYGTDFVSVPEPGTLSLLLSGSLIAFGFGSRRRRRAAAAAVA